MSNKEWIAEQERRRAENIQRRGREHKQRQKELAAKLEATDEAADEEEE